ncbi:MAG: subclass B1 metallo-beta-lactamase [Melioribacteraceae bacterium]|nr:subclass B1 metallo-beta-lactamase [Melioribacteraceae bacterium]
MKYPLKGIILLLIVNQLSGQEIRVSDDLILKKISNNCYVHTQNNNNGLIYINNGQAIIVSTPDSDIETQNLIDWVRNERHSKIVGYIIDRWHPDAMGGLDIVQKNDIKTYSYELTRQIAREKGLPIPEIGFNSQKVINVGDKKVICNFLGEAHTTDGIVVWIPSEEVLFGGNEIREHNGWVGNISDANLDKWSETAKRIKKEYGAAKIVIPGHGNYGGPELIDYTINLYDLSPNVSTEKASEVFLSTELKTDNVIFIKAEYDSLHGGERILKNAIVVVQDSTKFIEIESPQIIYQPVNQRINSETGRVKIYDKKNDKEILRIDVNYNRLIVYEYDNTIGFVVVLRGIENNNRN